MDIDPRERAKRAAPNEGREASPEHQRQRQEPAGGQGRREVGAAGGGALPKLEPLLQVIQLLKGAYPHLPDGLDPSVRQFCDLTQRAFVQLGGVLQDIVSGQQGVAAELASLQQTLSVKLKDEVRFFVHAPASTTRTDVFDAVAVCGCTTTAQVLKLEPVGRPQERPRPGQPATRVQTYSCVMRADLAQSCLDSGHRLRGVTKFAGVYLSEDLTPAQRTRKRDILASQDYKVQLQELRESNYLVRWRAGLPYFLRRGQPVSELLRQPFRVTLPHLPNPPTAAPAATAAGVGQAQGVADAAQQRQQGQGPTATGPSSSGAAAGAGSSGGCGGTGGGSAGGSGRKAAGAKGTTGATTTSTGAAASAVH